MDMDTEKATITENGDTCTVYPSPNKSKTAIYTFHNAEGNVIGEFTGALPVSLTTQSTVVKFLKELLDPENKIKASVINNDIRSIKELLQINYDATVLRLEDERIQSEQEKQHEKETLMKQAMEIIRNSKQPLIYIASLVDWFTAGERANIMLAFLVYAGQVIINNPISLIGLGESSSGKSHIQEVALDLIPSEYVVYEKKITEPALFNRAKTDTYFYDGKIVNYGDMGGINDQDFIQESKNLMKELQSDGYLNKPLSVPDGEGGWTVKDLKLIGKPCLTYTTVPNHRFDDQELSRSIFYTPRMDNREIFNRRNSILEFKTGRTYKKLKEYEKEFKMIPNIVLHLKQVLQDIIIINPYVTFINMFLSKSKYYKRDFPKYNGLLKTITAINYYNNFKYTNEDGQTILFTSIVDVQLFISILEPYQESITTNIAPKSVEVLTEIKENIHKWTKKTTADDDLQVELGSNGITTNDYFTKSELGLSKDSVKKYIYELHEKGYLKVVGREGKSNLYNLADNEITIINNDLKQLSVSNNPLLVSELGEEIAEQVKDSEEFIEDLNILNQDEEVDIPNWLM